MSSSPPIRIALIGYGYWGPNIARNISALDEFELVAICDGNPERRATASRQHRSAAIVESADEVFAIASLDAVAIATPVATHFPLVMSALEAGLHVFVEKPLADSVERAAELELTARQRELRLMVGHTFVYTGAVRKLRQLVESGDLGELLYFDSCRVNLGLLQRDVDVVWDLAVHDLAILDFVSGLAPLTVSAVGVLHAPSTQRSSAFLTFVYENDFVAHIDVNWFSPVKIRRTLLGGTRLMATWDDVEPSEKIKVYDSGVDVVTDEEVRRTQLVQYRTGDMWAPRIGNEEALAWEFRDFADWVSGGVEPPNSGAAGVRIVRMLEAAGASMDLGGAPVRVSV
jgi:predicted dehydrogenase